jgi:hypothetical protein
MAADGKGGGTGGQTGRGGDRADGRGEEQKRGWGWPMTATQ